MAETFDVNAEYEKIFGKESRDNLFSFDDEEYQILRQSIIETKRIFNFKNSLPFEGITLLPYKEFLRTEKVYDAEAKGFRVFYIKKYVGNTLSIYAAGYFDNSKFVVLKGAFFAHSEYFSSLTRDIKPIMKRKFTMNYQYNNGILTQRRNWTFDSASLAASYILGKKSTFKEWVDDRNKTLDAYYAKYRSAYINEYENKTFPDYLQPTSSIAVSHKTDLENANNKPATNRAKETAIPTDNLASSTSASTHLFFIHKDISPTRFCHAFGKYNKTTQNFIMKSGSILSLETTTSYNNTAQGTARRDFLNEFCSKEVKGYRLERDYLFDSPSAAASCAIGSISNGWSAWKDKNGKTLADVYRALP